MRRTALCLLMVFCLVGLAFAVTPTDWSASSTPQWGIPTEPSAVDSGGPDTYGYRWKQTADLGGPPFAWRDISAVGTSVTGLGDDNYVGPFPIGFSFHYYWYDVTQYYIGSNGYIEFSQPFNAASPFPNNIPLTTLPNDFLTPYMADFDFTAGGQCRRYNNADSCIISFTNLPFWSYGGSHNFEIIMSRLDSNITYEFGVNTGISGNPDFLVGIENVSGTMGLKHSNDVYPASNNAIKWYHPANPTVVVHDMAAAAAGNTTSTGFFVVSGGSLAPMGIVKNVGNVTETSYQVNCTIQTTTGVVVYNQTQTISTPLAPSAEQTINFTPSWTASSTGTYFFKITVTVANDLNPNNNLMSTELGVITMPGTMGYDDGISEQGWSWQGGNGGLGQHFVPPVYPAIIDSVEFFIPTSTITSPHPFTAQVLDDNGTNGSPGTVLWSTSVSTPTGGQWYRLVPSPAITISSGGFYVGWQMTDSLTLPLGTDMTTTNPFSRQGWEFTGVWSNWRNSETGDIMIRARVHTTGGTPDLQVTLTPINPPIQVPAIGGSFQFNATVQRTLGPQAPFVVWARDRNPDGTYSSILLGPVTINPPVGQSVTRQRTQNVPGTWQAGLHWYIGYAGPAVAYPATDADSFSWTKLATGANGPMVWDATNYGEPFPGETMVSAPTSFSVVGATPNPFNPTTSINFNLPETQHVLLNVYDVNGRLVATLVNGVRQAGAQKVTFDGSNLASGVYLYTLNAGQYSASGKMVLMK